MTKSVEATEPLHRPSALPEAARRFLPRATLAAFLAAWLVATHVPHIPGPPGPGSWDKVAHFTGYAILAWLVWWNLPSFPRLAQFALVLLIAGIVGGLDEVTQKLVPNRHAEFADWRADMLGAFAMLCFVWSIVVWLDRGRTGASYDPEILD